MMRPEPLIDLYPSLCQMVAATEAWSKQIKTQREGVSPLVWSRESRTVRFGVGRRMGNTTLGLRLVNEYAPESLFLYMTGEPLALDEDPPVCKGMVLPIRTARPMDYYTRPLRLVVVDNAAWVQDSMLNSWMEALVHQDPLWVLID